MDKLEPWYSQVMWINYLKLLCYNINLDVELEQQSKKLHLCKLWKNTLYVQMVSQYSPKYWEQASTGEAEAGGYQVQG